MRIKTFEKIQVLEKEIKQALDDENYHKAELLKDKIIHLLDEYISDVEDWVSSYTEEEY